MTAVHKRLAVNGGTIAAFTVAWSEPDNMPEWCSAPRLWRRHGGGPATQNLRR